MATNIIALARELAEAGGPDLLSQWKLSGDANGYVHSIMRVFGNRYAGKDAIRDDALDVVLEWLAMRTLFLRLEHCNDLWTVKVHCSRLVARHEPAAHYLEAAMRAALWVCERKEGKDG